MKKILEFGLLKCFRLSQFQNILTIIYLTAFKKDRYPNFQTFPEKIEKQRFFQTFPDQWEPCNKHSHTSRNQEENQVNIPTVITKTSGSNSIKSKSANTWNYLNKLFIANSLFIKREVFANLY